MEPCALDPGPCRGAWVRVVEKDVKLGSSQRFQTRRWRSDRGASLEKHDLYVRSTQTENHRTGGMAGNMAHWSAQCDQSLDALAQDERLRMRTLARCVALSP